MLFQNLQKHLVGIAYSSSYDHAAGGQVTTYHFTSDYQVFLCGKQSNGLPITDILQSSEQAERDCCSVIYAGGKSREIEGEFELLVNRVEFHKRIG